MGIHPLVQFSSSKIDSAGMPFEAVIPAEAGIQDFFLIFLDSRFHGNDKKKEIFEKLNSYNPLNF